MQEAERMAYLSNPWYHSGTDNKTVLVHQHAYLLQVNDPTGQDRQVGEGADQLA
jgi:hypothetical protein